jgi:hypothetical protein
MSDERYCSAKDYEPIKLRWHKYRPDWCPKLEKNRRAKDERFEAVSVLQRERPVNLH